MQSWSELCNMRSSLLHLQFLYCSLSERIAQQRSQISRAHRDRLMQYSSLWQEFINTEQLNFKRLIIMKLESCLNVYGNDGQIWDLIDSFTRYMEVVEHDMMDNISKLYLGKRVMMDIKEVESELKKIEEKIVSFLNTNGPKIDEYNNRMQTITQTRLFFTNYLKEIGKFYEQIAKIYPKYLSNKLKQRMQEIDKEICHLKDAIMS